MNIRQKSAQIGGYERRGKGIDQVLEDADEEECGREPSVVTSPMLGAILIAAVEGIYKRVQSMPAHGKQV